MKSTRYTGIAALSALALAACSESNGPNDEIDQAINEDVAVVAADAALEDLQQMTVQILSGDAVSFEGAPPTTRSRVVTFFDADGLEMDAYNPETTASMSIVMDMDGAVERDGWSASVERHRELLVTGMLGDETSRTWNGTGDGTVSRSQHADGADGRSYTLVSSLVITDVVRGLPRAENPWPLSGTITRSFTITITNGVNGDEVRQRTVTIEFDGTQFAVLTVNGETFEVDLAARERDKPVRRR